VQEDIFLWRATEPHPRVQLLEHDQAGIDLKSDADDKMAAASKDVATTEAMRQKLIDYRPTDTKVYYDCYPCTMWTQPDNALGDFIVVESKIRVILAHCWYVRSNTTCK
jgi:hypothetical protein